MIETPERYNDRAADGAVYPADNLTRYRFHTGAELRQIGNAEACPVLFRDLGPVAMARFLRGELQRLAGPLTPIIYMRTEEYAEPYTDYEGIGRLVILRPLELHPWHSGVPHVFVARATREVSASTLAFVPGRMTLKQTATRLTEIANAADWREALGGRHFDAECRETVNRLEALATELAETERWLQPLRLALQSSQSARRDQALETMGRFGLGEDDLCAAWHHLPRERRELMRDALQEIASDRAAESDCHAVRASQIPPVQRRNR